MTTVYTTLSFTSLIQNYKNIQSTLLAQVNALGSLSSSAQAGQFILLQFQMSQVTQVGESISNMISQVNTMINNAVRNQKTS